MKLSDIKPGMIIEYRGRVYGHGNLIGRDKTRTGTVTQVTPNLIVVQGQRYPDTILVNDLLSGQVKIISLKGEGEMVKKLDWETLGPQIDELRAQGKTIKAIAEELGISETTTHSYLVKQGTNKKQTPTLEPEQAANQEPDEGEGESATEIIPEPYYKCEDCGKGLTCEEVREFNPAGYVNEETKILCSWCFFNNIARMPIGCSLPLEDSTEPQGDEMAESDTGQEKETVEYYPDWPPKDPIERALLETTMNARFAVRRVLNDPVALALMKQVLESGVI